MNLITKHDVLDQKLRAEAKAWKSKCIELQAEIERLKSERKWTDKEGVERPAGLEVTAWSWAEGDAFRPDALHPGQASEF